MYRYKFFKIFLILLLPILLLSEEAVQTKENTTVDIQKTIEERIKEQQTYAENIINNINEDKYLDDSFNERDYDKEINYLQNRMDINQREHNDLAVKRDEIKLLILQEERMFITTLTDINYAKKSFKDAKFFENIISNNIKLLENSDLKEYKTLYIKEQKNNNKISNGLTKNYEELISQNNQQLYTLKYLLENIGLYRKTNFFIDNFNLQYLVSKIDSYPIIAPISQLTSYHLKFSVGDIVVVLFILLLFKLFITKIIHLFIGFLNNLIFKNRTDINSEEEEEDNSGTQSYLEESIEKPLVVALYILSIQISLYILIKDNELLNQIMPWVNTVYMGLFTWAIYSLLSNSITNFAQHLIEKYPNVRREMIVFILRIIKVILILLVILFLFTQLGIDIKAIAASLGVGGIAIALASKDTLANFFGSLNIMTDNSFSQGDWIVANSVEGTVVDIRMRTTRIRTFDNAMITVPNSELANTHIKNYSKRRIGRRIKMKIGITYESAMEDIVNLKKDIFEMLDTHPHIASNKNIKQSKSRKFEAIKREDLQGVKRTLLVYIDEYDASSINILIYCFTRSPNWEDWLTVKEDVLIKISELVQKNNCEFAYPTQTLFMKK